MPGKIKDYSTHRAKVVDNHDPKKWGRIGVHIVDLQGTTIDSKKLYWALPANSAFVGSPQGPNYNTGQCIVPPIGTIVHLYFEDGDFNKPLYETGASFESDKCLPFENTIGKAWEKTFTLMKTPKGRAIVLSDDSDSNAQSLIIKGQANQKRSESSLYSDSDMAIVLSEGSGKEKLRIQTGNADQYIEIDKDKNKTTIHQGPNTYIELTNSGIKLKSPRIDIN